jgi:hypothetical protein
VHLSPEVKGRLLGGWLNSLSLQRRDLFGRSLRGRMFRIEALDDPLPDLLPTMSAVVSFIVRSCGDLS